MQNAHREFLADAVVQLWAADQKKQALAFLRLLRKLYPNPAYNVPVEDFVLQESRLNMQRWDPRLAQQLISDHLRRAFLAYAFHDDETGDSLTRLARLIYERHVAFYRARDVILDIPPFEQIRDRALQDALRALSPALARELRETMKKPEKPAPSETPAP
jgi:hypothetical protein